MQVTIRPFKSSDAGNLQRAILCSVGHVGRWLEWCTPRYTLGTARSWLHESQELWDKGAAYRWAIVPRGSDPQCSNPILGCVEINRPMQEVPGGMMDYWVAREVAGRGVCTEAARQALLWSFEQLHLKQVQLLIQPDNKASIGVVKKLGATFEERMEGAITYKDQPKAANCYAITPEALAEVAVSGKRRAWPLNVAYDASRS